jgi:hypothetical protein
MKKKKPTRSDRRQKELRRLAPWLFLFEAFAAAKATAGAPKTSLSHTGKKYHLQSKMILLFLNVFDAKII